MATLLETKNLKKYFKANAGMVHAVDDVSFSVEEGTTLGLVGESGCGKSTLGRTLIHLNESTDGQIIFAGKDVTKLNRKEMKEYRKNVQMIFQDPYSSIDPRQTIEDTIMEPLKLEGELSKEEIIKRTKELMEIVGIEKRLRMSYPHELDGGRRQRVGIARALALNPKFIVCDEPVSALDVSIQAQILNLLMDLQRDLGLTYLFITHDMSVVKHISKDICVMYLGQMVEKCDRNELFAHPFHPYTKALLSAIPTTDIHNKKQRIILKGEIKSPINPGPGCRFASRCPYADESCKCSVALQEVGDNHFVACNKVKEINGL
ncbi:MAG: ATP-binding cassette domain-containing protein [Pseudobutyrivibrio ruminis]|uniref:ABC transporter ATP-binding protein n=1 Tax=Pseudobutyrivibrio ruminis TaxID=46206 RepID=UPI0026ED0D15|nr:oligopeptide/dipeptide ABC transporter ATP-binding protein [Pseudobutyrivibrio ruminis]MBE5912645.1 ATP-binding cassette domain-containing protein [Pseudobutyrivibrio ruminis]